MGMLASKLESMGRRTWCIVLALELAFAYRCRMQSVSRP